MALYAVDDLGDAIEATKTFLLPVEWSRWLRLALITLFVGGSVGLQGPMNFGSSSTDFGGPTSGTPGGGFTPANPPSTLPGPIHDHFWLVVGGVVAVAILVSLLLGFIGAVMEFVFVESLHRDAVHIRQYFGRYWRAGLRLFAFRFGVTLLGLATIVAVALAVFGGVPTDPQPDRIVAALIVLVPVILVVGPLIALINGFTTAFVVPIMLAEDRAVLPSWRRFWPTLRGQWKQYGGYVLMAFVLTIAIGLVVATVMGVGAVVLLIPFAIVGAIAFLAGGAHLSLAVGIVVGILALLYVVSILAFLALVQVPLQTFLRLYTLLILGDTNEDFDVIADLRADVRA